MRPKVLLSWSSGKDSAWTLQVLRQRSNIEVVGLLTTINTHFQRVAMHGTRYELLQAQTAAGDRYRAGKIRTPALMSNGLLGISSHDDS